jgi:transcriptional regulator with XRE-family HTH domain
MADLQALLGYVLRQERQNQDLTMKELGEKAGLSEIYIGEIERGQKYPSAKVLESLARALELDLATLLELVAGEIRREREPEITQVIGFTYNTNNHKGRRSRTGVQRMINMVGIFGADSPELLEDTGQLLDLNTFLRSRNLTPV